MKHLLCLCEGMTLVLTRLENLVLCLALLLTLLLSKPKYTSSSKSHTAADVDEAI